MTPKLAETFEIQRYSKNPISFNSLNLVKQSRQRELHDLFIPPLTDQNTYQGAVAADRGLGSRGRECKGTQIAAVNHAKLTSWD